MQRFINRVLFPSPVMPRANVAVESDTLVRSDVDKNCKLQLWILMFIYVYLTINLSYLCQVTQTVTYNTTVVQYCEWNGIQIYTGLAFQCKSVLTSFVSTQYLFWIHLQRIWKVKWFKSRHRWIWVFAIVNYMPSTSNYNTDNTTVHWVSYFTLCFK